MHNWLEKEQHPREREKSKAESPQHIRFDSFIAQRNNNEYFSISLRISIWFFCMYSLVFEHKENYSSIYWRSSVSQSIDLPIIVIIEIWQTEKKKKKETPEEDIINDDTLSVTIARFFHLVLMRLIDMFIISPLMF